jgi:UDP-2,3-diacylglucosamine pyrophosphatase LpxH
MAHKWLAFMGDAAYELLMKLNVVVNAVRRRLDLPYWSLSKHAKHKVKDAVAFISRFEEAVAHEAGRLNADGVVCGHIHTAEERAFGDIVYYNDGDWVESCTALVEHHDGRMEILHWAEEMAARSRPAQALQAAA